MKSLRELTKMSDNERQSYLKAHKDEITYEWLRSAKKKNDRRGWEDPARARDAAQVLVGAAEVRGESSILALANWALGNAYLFDERPRRAIEHFERAIDFYREAERPLDVARVELSYMWAWIKLGDPDRALDVAELIRPVLTESPEEQDRGRLAKLAGNVGIALEFRGDYEAALLAYRRMQNLAREVWDGPEADIHIARMEQNRALALTKLNRLEEAATAYQKARDVLEEHEVTADVIRVYTGLGWLYDRGGREEEAQEAFEQARAWLNRLSDEESLQAADLALYALRGQLEHAPMAVAAEAARLHQAYAGRAFFYGQEAALLEAHARLLGGDTEETRRICAQVEQALEGRSLAGLLWRVHYLTGRAWEDDDKRRARERYERAVEVIERDQRRIADVQLRASVLEDKLDVYRDLAALLVGEGEYEAALEIVERSKARVLVDALRERMSEIPLPEREEDKTVRRLRRELEALRAELDRRYRQQGREGAGEVRSAPTSDDGDLAHLEEAYIGKARELSHRAPAYGTVLGTYVAPLDEIRQALPPDALLVEFYATIGGESFALLVTPDGVRHHSLGATDEVERLIEELPQRALASPDESVWRELYDLLIAPWASELDEVRRLVFVPDGPLHYVPFQAVQSPETGRYLIQDYEVSYAPSATLLTLASRTRPGRRDTALALGYDGGQLIHVSAEMGTIAGAFPGLTMFTGDQASRERLREFASQADVVHVAAHGDFRSDAPLFSFIALADGRWQVTDIYRQRLDASLVTLGACWTGRGRLTGGDLMGFAHALFYAGAQSALVSLWPVHDASTAALMAAFYRGLREGQRKAEALRQAQLTLLNSERWGNPIYWAPFCLMGADGLVGAAGMMRAVRRIVESGALSAQERERLLDQIRQASRRYPDDLSRFVEHVNGAVDSSPELRSLLAVASRDSLNLKPLVERVGQAAETLVNWRWVSTEDMAEIGEGERPVGPATTEERPTDNETVLMERAAAWRWFSGKAMEETATGEKPLGRVTSASTPVYNETVDEIHRIRRKLKQTVERIEQTEGEEE